MSPITARAVRFDDYGDRDVLRVDEIPMPAPDPGEVVVAVRAAGISPGEMAIRAGYMHDRLPATFPSGQGSDLAGVITQVGPDVEGLAVGDEVLGYSWTRSSQATHTAVPASQLIPKPAGLSWEVAGSLYVVACTAYAAVRAVAAGPGDTVAVSAAAGGVGTVVVQLLAVRGATVLGIASPANDDWLLAPVLYGDGLADRLRRAAPDGVDAFIDLFGPDYLDVAVELGIARHRIETIISFARAAELGVKAEGSGEARSSSSPDPRSRVSGHPQVTVSVVVPTLPDASVAVTV
jgi:NADPH2:quinone reductase